MILLTESEEVIRLLPERHVLSDRIYVRKHGKMTIRMAYEMVMPYHLHMPSYFLETFTEYPFLFHPHSSHSNSSIASVISLSVFPMPYPRMTFRIIRSLSKIKKYGAAPPVR